MPIPRPVAALVGIVSLSPLGYAIYSKAKPLWAPIGARHSILSSDVLAPADIAFLALSLLLAIVCIILVYRLSSVNPAKRGAWLLFLLFGSIFAIPVFWFLHVYRNPPDYVEPSDP